MRQWAWSMWTVVVLLSLGSAGSAQELAPVVTPRIVFIIDGAADSSASATGLQGANVPHQLLYRERITWCRYGSNVKDFLDHERHVWAADQLVFRIQTIRQIYPQASISLMSHSTGTHIALLAAGKLPPDSLDQVILLAGSVTQTYDLRPALRATRSGITNFSSHADGILNIAEGIGSADGPRAPLAGRWGFVVSPEMYASAPELYAKLRQYRWSPQWDALGHLGGHEGCTRPDFMRVYVVPFLLAPPPPIMLQP